MATSGYVSSSAARAIPSWFENPIIRYFLWAAKTDTRLISLCAPSTRRTHVARGFFVTMTGIGAAAAAWYFIHTTLGSAPAALLIGAACGMLIFMFDREIVGGTTLKSAWLRITLSFILGMTIAIPF